MKAQIKLFLQIFIPLFMVFGLIVLGGSYVYKWYTKENAPSLNAAKWESTFLGTWESHAYQIRLVVEEDMIYVYTNAELSAHTYRLEMDYYEGAFYIMPTEENDFFGIYDYLIFYPDRTVDSKAPLLLGQSGFHNFANYKDTLYRS